MPKDTSNRHPRLGSQNPFAKAGLLPPDHAGITPEDNYGTLDAKRFCLPEMLSLAPGAKAASIIKELDENLRHIREVSRALLATLAEERSVRDLNVSSYQLGDLVLFNPRE